EISRARSSRAQHAKQNHRRGFRRLGAGTRNLFSKPMGRTFHADSRLRRSRRRTQIRLTAHRAIRQRLFRLYRPGLFPRIARRRAGCVSFVRELGFAGEMKSSDSHEESPGVPGFKTWRGVYFFVFGWFALVVILLAIFTRYFA